MDGNGNVLGEALASQAGVHEAWGGVVPKLAQQAHKAAIDETVDLAMAAAAAALHDRDAAGGGTASAPPAGDEDTAAAVAWLAGRLSAVAVTVGPGLAPCLQVGVAKAYELAAREQLPLVRVHHMEAHALVTRLPPAGVAAGSALTPAFPYATVLVSGGHNMVRRRPTAPRCITASPVLTPWTLRVGAALHRHRRAHHPRLDPGRLDRRGLRQDRAAARYHGHPGRPGARAARSGVGRPEPAGRQALLAIPEPEPLSRVRPIDLLLDFNMKVPQVGFRV